MRGMTEPEFRAVISGTKRAVLGAIRRYLAPDLRDLVDDVAQDTYLRLYRYIEKNASDGVPANFEALSSLAYVIARNESLRTNGKNRRTHLDVPDSIPDTRTSDHEEVRGHLDAASALLDRELQSVFNLRTRGLSTEEIAEQLGLPAGTVKSRMHRARRNLRERARDWFN